MHYALRITHHVSQTELVSLECGTSFYAHASPARRGWVPGKEENVMVGKIGGYVCVLTCIVILSFSFATPCIAGQKDTLVIGLEEKTTSIDPAKLVETVSAEIVNRVYEKLVTFEEGNYTEPISELAESWELSEDGKTWTFHLRKGVSFTSGNPVNADAVVFSLRRIIRLAGGWEWLLTQFGMTEESITKIDEYTVQIVLDQPYAPNLILSCLAVSGICILDPQVVMEHELEGDMGSAWLEEHSAGSAQYILAERKRGERIVLEANPQSWKGKPTFERIILKHVPEPVAQMALLEKGEVDVAYNLQSAQLKRLKANPDIRIARGSLFHIRYLGMNLAYEPLSKPEVRDAIRYAIDYDGIVNYIFDGAAMTIQTIIPKGVPGYNPATPYSRDLEKAKQLLADAGYPDGFEVELLCFNSSPWQDVAMKIKSDLAEAGINVKVTPLPARQRIAKYKSRDFQMVHGNWNMDYADPSGIVIIFGPCESSGDDASVKMIAWRNHYVDVETFELAQQAIQERNPEKRTALYKQITDTILNDGPYVVLFSLIKQYAYRVEVEHGLGAPSPFSGFPTIK